MQRLTLAISLALIILLVGACNSATPAPTSPPPGQGNQPPKGKPTVVEPTALPQAKPTVAKPTIVEPTVPPKATASTGVSVPTLGPTTAVSFLKECVMAKSVDPTTFAPIDVTTKYATTQDKFYALCLSEQTPAGTAFKALWYLLPSQARSSASKIGENTFSATKSGSGYVQFYINASSAGHQEGMYRVEVYVNDKLARTIDFSVAK